MELYYFGYGANKDPKIIEAVTGKSPKGKMGYIEGFELCIQGINNLPKIPQKIIKKAWTKGFQSYALRKGKHKVYGRIWKINKDDLERIREWELYEEGWFKSIRVNVVLENGSNVKAYTDIIENQKVIKVVNGKNYKTHLNNPEKIIAHAKKIFGKKN